MTYSRSEFNVTCDVCGIVVPRSKAKLRWDGCMCCLQDWEKRHIADNPPPVYKNEGRGVKNARPQQNEVFRTVATSSDNYKKYKVWGSEGNSIWGGTGDPSTWGEDL